MKTMQNMALNLVYQFMDYILANAGKIKLAIKKFSLKKSFKFVQELLHEQCFNKSIHM